MNNRIIIISDIHHHIDWVEPFLLGQKYDKVIFLGDYFDDFNDNANDAFKTARWLKKMIEDNRNIFLWGNHDMSYGFPHNQNLYCPGFEESKNRAANSILTKKDWNKLKLVHFEDNFIFCHGGILSQHFEHPVLGLTKETIQSRCDKAMENAVAGIYDPVLNNWGIYRGDFKQHGGIIWADWQELYLLEGFNQVVGHTPSREIRYFTSTYSSETYGIKIINVKFEKNDHFNMCLDTHNCHYGLLEDGCFSFHLNPYIKPKKY